MKCALVARMQPNINSKSLSRAHFAHHFQVQILHFISIFRMPVDVAAWLPSSVSNFSRNRLIKCKTVSFFISPHISWSNRARKKYALQFSVSFQIERQSTGRCSPHKRMGRRKTKVLVDMIVGCMFACHLLCMWTVVLDSICVNSLSEIERWDSAWWFFVVHEIHLENIKYRMSFIFQYFMAIEMTLWD